MFVILLFQGSTLKSRGDAGPLALWPTYQPQAGIGRSLLCAHGPHSAPPMIRLLGQLPKGGSDLKAAEYA